jgi:hypothetical protein
MVFIGRTPELIGMDQSRKVTLGPAFNPRKLIDAPTFRLVSLWSSAAPCFSYETLLLIASDDGSAAEPYVRADPNPCLHPNPALEDVSHCMHSRSYCDGILP